MTDLVTVVRSLLTLAERDPDRACREFDRLVVQHGPTAPAQALREVAGAELATLGYAA